MGIILFRKCAEPKFSGGIFVFWQEHLKQQPFVVVSVQNKESFWLNYILVLFIPNKPSIIAQKPRKGGSSTEIRMQNAHILIANKFAFIFSALHTCIKYWYDDVYSTALLSTKYTTIPSLHNYEVLTILCKYSGCKTANCWKTAPLECDSPFGG